MNVEISKEVVRVERWQGRIIAAWMMIRQQMAQAEKEAFGEEVETKAGLSDGQTMLCVAGDFNAHNGVVEPGDKEGVGRFGWEARNGEGHELVEMLRRNGLAIAGTFFDKTEINKITYRSTRQSSTYWWCGNGSSGG